MPNTAYALTLPLTPLLRQAKRLAQTVIRLVPAHKRPQPRAYLVGGAVRDIILNLPPKDIDIEVYHVTFPQLSTLLKKTYGDIPIRANARYGTWEIRTQAGSLNVSIPRTETQHGPGHTDLKVTLRPHLSRAKALARRDFTINAILADALTGKVYDPYQGARDIQKGILQPVAINTFAKDALRAWRAVQLLGRYNLRPGTTLQHLLKHMAKAPAMRVLSAERILAECDKLFTPGSKPSNALKVAQTSGLLTARIQPLAKLGKKPTAWRALLVELDRCAATKSKNTQAACWHAILKALSPQAGLVLIHTLKLPKKYRLPKSR